MRPDTQGLLKEHVSMRQPSGEEHRAMEKRVELGFKEFSGTSEEKGHG